jgi:uncharacterized membrane protein
MLGDVMSKEIDLAKCFGEGWKLYKNNLGILILSSLLAAVVGSFTCGILYPPMFVGLFLIIDRLMKQDPEKPVAGDIFKGMSKLAPALICYIIFIVVITIACAVPVVGQIAALVATPLMMFAFLYITFEDMDAIEAIKRVFQELFSGKLLMPVVIGVLAGMAGSVGAIACVIGIFVTMPFTPVVYMITYREMCNNNDDDILDAEIVSTDESTTGETQPETAPPKAPAAPESAEIADEASDDEPPTVG